MGEPVASDAALLLDRSGLAAATARVAAAIDADHPLGVTVVGVLKGSALFLADVVRLLTVPVRVEFVAVAPYDGTTSRARVVKDLDRSITGEAVVLVMGIYDTGLTADFLLRHLQASEPASVRVAALVDKPVRRLLPTSPHYAAVVAPDRFVIGYGLDYAGRYRNLDSLWTADGAALADDPDRHVSTLYGHAGPPTYPDPAGAGPARPDRHSWR